jgi:hypothetical protein
MSDVTIEVIGVQKLLGKFAKLDANMQKQLNEAAEKSAVVIHKRAATYPRKRPSSKYRRTDNLMRRWKHKVSNGSAVVSNKTRYGKWVMGATEQATVHKGRWARTDQIAEEQAQKVNRFYEYAVEQATK